MGYVLLLGGARSGKSDLAVRLALESGLPVTVIATAAAGDEEMAERICQHRAARPATWTTIEAPVDLLGAIHAAADDDMLIVDCLTLWVANLMEAGGNASDIALVTDAVVGRLSERRGVVVTNEVGLGIVPANELARRYRDVLGSVNARFAEGAEKAVLLVAGRAVELGRAGTVHDPG
jgi:adenosyl cobinamide kinase/adenosyl cobinamide phosphate guanylyltransferase